MYKSIKKSLKWGVVIGVGVILVILGVGCQGPPGEKGPTGPAGSPGAAGEKGAPGISAGTVTGMVTALATGSGVEKATVVTVPATASVTTDAKGNYKIENVPIGAYSVKASLKGYNAASIKVSVTDGKTITANLDLETEEPFALARVKGVGYRMSDTDTYPDGKLRLTTHYSINGEALTHGENLIQTSGLPNVAVGGYVYLEGKGTDAAEKKITAWEWTVVGPGESEVVLENTISPTPRFKADKVGKYEVLITATNEEGKKSSSELAVYAGTYVGAATCIACHSGSVMPDTVSEWQQTGHATKLIGTYASYTLTRDYCIVCHATGYDERDKAGGFDDLAKQAGWDSSKESLTTWLVGNKWTVEQIMTSPMEKLANVQCESCHGPGLIHEGVKTAKKTGALFQPDACTQCHPQEVQWRNSGHANTGAKEMHMAEGTSCVECHTGQGFVEVKVRGKTPVFPNMATAEEPATLAEPSQQPPVACAACHDPHAFTEPFNKGTTAAPNIASLQLRIEGKITMPSGVTVDARESALCVSCHANKRDLAYKTDYAAGKKSRGAHDNTQADNFYGVSAAAFDYGTAYGSSPHPALVEEGCIQCHMAENPQAPAGAKVDNKLVISSHGKTVLANAGDHTWSMVGSYQGQEIENTGPCLTSGCHAEGSITTFNREAYADYDGDGKVEGIQDEVQGLLDILAAKLPKDDKGNLPASGLDKMKLTEAQLKALWNYSLIANDGSRGIHNTAYAVQVLQRTYKQLTGSDVPGATMR